MTEPVDRPTVSDAIRSVVVEAERFGADVDQVAEWSQATVVRMKEPMTNEVRRHLRSHFSSLRYFRTKGDAHNPAHEGLFDDENAAAISFPLKI